MAERRVYLRSESPSSNYLTKKIEEARTLVFVRTRTWESGRYQYLGGKDAGPAKSWTVTVALVDAADFGRQRVLQAASAAPPKIRGNTHYCGHNTVDGITHDGTENTSSLLHKLLERVLEQNKAGAAAVNLASPAEGGNECIKSMSDYEAWQALTVQPPETALERTGVALWKHKSGLP